MTESVAVCLVFLLARAGFCWIHHSDFRLRLLDSISLILWLLVSAIVLSFLSLPYAVLVIITLFMVTGFAARWMARQGELIVIGIIEYVWISILAFACGGILFARSFSAVQVGSIPIGQSIAFYNQVGAELSFLLSKVIELTMLLGTILAAAMAILWGKDIWRSRGEEGKQHYVSSTRAAIAMAFSYFVILVSIVCWIALPLYVNYSAVKDYMREADGSTKAIHGTR
jgi:hypothetical protein